MSACFCELDVHNESGYATVLDIEGPGSHTRPQRTRVSAPYAGFKIIYFIDLGLRKHHGSKRDIEERYLGPNR
jgi:hypothetical protein